MKWFVSIIIVILLSQAVLSMTCLTDPDPYIRLTTPPVAVCVLENDTNTRCMTFLSNPDNTSEEWGVMPERTHVLDISGDGASYEKISYYPVIDNSVIVSFSTERLITNQTVTGNIWCGSEIHTFNFTPQYIDYAEIADYAISVKNNVMYIILTFIVIALLFLLWGSIKPQ